SGGGMFVAVGEAGTVLSSPDGTNWSYRSSSPSPELNGVTYGNGQFVAVGHAPSQSLIMISSNGVTWEKTAVPGVYAGFGVAFGNGLFAAAGINAIITSANARDWTVAQSPLSSQLESIAFIRNEFIAVGDNGSMLASADGQTWNPRNS